MKGKSRTGVIITAPRGYLDEGLFGRVLLWILEILPHLKHRGIYPQWRIPSALYGVGPDQVAIPGVLDLAYDPPDEIIGELSLVDLRNKYCSHLGPDWQAIHELWTSYFQIPRRVYASADAFPVPDHTLGVHYRGTDKVTAAWDSNAFSKEEMVMLVQDYLGQNPSLQTIFVASDEAAFIDLLKESVECDVISLGSARHHKDHASTDRSDYSDADRAIVDCLLLSRCSSVLLTSSALSAFAKVLNPDLRIHRCAASKMFLHGPYFPVAYIPVYEPRSNECRALLQRTLQGDWRQRPGARRFSGKFASKPNWYWRLRAKERAIKRRVYPLLFRPPPQAGDYFIK